MRIEETMKKLGIIPCTENELRELAILEKEERSEGEQYYG